MKVHIHERQHNVLTTPKINSVRGTGATMRLILGLFLFLVFFQSTLLTFGQTPPQVQKDPTAVSLLVHTVAALGGTPASPPSCLASGNLTNTSTSNSSTPIVIMNEGSSLIRTELTLDQGTNVLSVNNGAGAIISPDGSVRHLNTDNMLFRRAVHIPLLSQISEFQSPNTFVEYLGQGDGNTDRVAISLAPPGTTQQVMASTTRTMFDLDRVSGFVTKMQFTSFAENVSNDTELTEIRFSDYRQVNSMAIPFNVQEYSDGALHSTLILNSVDCQASISDSEFVLPN
jgi:hypothetical protein